MAKHARHEAVLSDDPWAEEARAAAQPQAGGGKDYDWLDDPFNDSPQKAKMGKGSKAFIGVGCLVVLVLIVVLLAMGLSGISTLAESM